MSAETDIKMRVWVEDAWDRATFVAGPTWTVAHVKSEALRLARQTEPELDNYQVKLRGAVLPDESRTLAELAVRDLAPFVVLSARRRPVR